MENIRVRRYENDELREHWHGFVEPESLDWILFLPAEGDPVLYTKRDPDTGAVA